MNQPILATAGAAGPARSDSGEPARWEGWAWVALALAVLTGLVLRGMIVFAGDLPRGINGGYYPVQVRAILRSGTLALPDFPLLFYGQTFLALVLKPFCATPGRAILWATQVTDTVLPCLAAVPVFMLARAWVPLSRRANLPIVVLVAGLVVVANPMVLRMAGDMQKNSAALGLALLFVVYADRYLRTQRPAAALGALVALGLTGLTHLGVFGMTLLLAALLGATAAWDSRHRRRLLLAVPLAVAVAVVMALLIFLFFDPTRIERLMGYLMSPARLLRRGRPDGGPGMGMGMGPGMGPGGPTGLLFRPDVLPGLLLGAMGLWMWLLLVDEDRAQRQTVLACSLAALALACPWLNPDLSNRLALMAVVPGAVGIVFALAHWPRVWGCAAAGGAIALLTVAGGWRQLQVGPPGGLSLESRADLEKIATQIKDPVRTLIIARHGLEWWTAWFTGARIANNIRAALPVWDQYDQVLSLTEIGGPQGPLFMGGPGLRPGGQGPGGQGPGGQGGGMLPPPGGMMAQGLGPRGLPDRPPQRDAGGMEPPRPPLADEPFRPQPFAAGPRPRLDALPLRELDAMLEEPLFPPPERPPFAAARAPQDRTQGPRPTPGDRRGGDGFAAALPGPGGQFEGLPGARSPALEPAYRGKALLMQRYLAKPAAPPEPLGR